MNEKEQREAIRKLPTSELILGLRGLAQDFRVMNRDPADRAAAGVLEEAAERLETYDRV